MTIPDGERQYIGARLIPKPGYANQHGTILKRGVETEIVGYAIELLERNSYNYDYIVKSIQIEIDMADTGRSSYNMDHFKAGVHFPFKTWAVRHEHCVFLSDQNDMGWWIKNGQERDRKE